MWAMTTEGFYSAVQDRKDPNKLHIRGRVKKDIVDLTEMINEAREKQGKPKVTAFKPKSSDYQWRVIVDREDFALAMARRVMQIDYTNFKSAVDKRSPKHGKVYHRVWSELLGLAHNKGTNYKWGTGWSNTGWTGQTDGTGLYDDEKNKARPLIAKGKTDAQVAKALKKGVQPWMIKKLREQDEAVAKLKAELKPGDKVTISSQTGEFALAENQSGASPQQVMVQFSKEARPVHLKLVAKATKKGATKKNKGGEQQLALEKKTGGQS